jgi:shikimate dehydrogenase
MPHLLGANVTVPHKRAVIPMLDGLTPEAEALEAVNTILAREGRLIGDNTDGAGFLAALTEAFGWEPVGRTAAVLGAGGSARAVAVSLARTGLRRLVILNRTAVHGVELAALVRSRASGCDVVALPLPPTWRPDSLSALDLLINTTSVGLRPADPLLIDPAGLPPEVDVVDLVYRPEDTPLVAAARRRGCRTASGLGMLLHQGALAVTRWTDRPAPIDAMRRALTPSA